MKKQLLATAIAGLFAVPAVAQVTVGGTLDTSYGSKTVATPVSASSTINPNGSRTQTSTETSEIRAVDNSFWSTSNINFKGTEDLGAGLKAFFHVEGAVLTDTGSANLADRVSQIGVSGAFGTVTLGRGSTAMNDLATSAGHGLGNFANLPFTTASRPNNAVNFITPSFNGISVRATIGEGESDKKDKASDYSAISVHGSVGKFSFAVAQANQKDVRTATAGRIFAFNSSVNSASISTASVAAFLASAASAADGTFGAIAGIEPGSFSTANILSVTQAVAAVNGKNRDTVVTAGYDFGIATVRFQHLRSKSSDNVSRGNGIQLVNRHVNAVTFTAPLGATTLFLNYQEHDRSKDLRSSSTGAINALATAATRPNDKNDVVIFGANYALSKRTSAYAVHRRVDNDSGSDYLSGVSGKDAKATVIGVRHSF